MEWFIMRKLALTLLLAASLPAFASVQSDLNGEMSAADAFTKANAGCETAACTEQVLAELLAAGVSIKDVLAIAISSGLSPDNAAKSLITAGAPADQVLAPTAANAPKKQATTPPVKATTPPVNACGISPNKPC